MTSKPQTKLIFGCGYLGRRVALKWLRDCADVHAMTRNSERATEFSGIGIRPVIGDICDPTSLQNLPIADTVLLAVGFDRTSGKSQHEVYVEGVQNVLNAISPWSCKLIYISSSSVYGQSNGEWVDERSECHPVTSGGHCCLEAENLVQRFAENSAHGLKTFQILRLSGLYGPSRLLTRIDQLRSGNPIAGSGDSWLNLIHIDDAVQAVIQCEKSGSVNQTILGSDDLPIRRSTYFDLLASLTGSPQPVFDSNVAARHGSGGLNKRCSNRKLRDEFNVQLRYPTINEGLPQSLNAERSPIDDPFPANG